MAERVGFVGLGIMGRGMAANLLKAGFEVRVWNRTASRMDALVADGAEAGESPADVAANCDIIVICVSDTPDVETVVLGENGVLEAAKPGHWSSIAAPSAPRSPRRSPHCWPRRTCTCSTRPSAAAARARPMAR